MQIKNVVFNKGDFRYSIEYFDGKAVRKVSTNEEALDSFDLSVAALAASLKIYLKIDETYFVKVKKIKFGNNDASASTIDLHVFFCGKDMDIKTKIIPIKKEEHFKDEELVSCNENLNEVRGEINRYISGEKAQQELPFEQELSTEVINDDFIIGDAND